MKIILGNITSKLVIAGKDGPIEHKLREYMKYRATGYSRTRAYKSHQWDGYNHLIGKTGNIATGFIPSIIKYLTTLGVEDIEVVDERKNMPRFKSGKMCWSLPDYDLVIHQKKMIVALRNSTLPLNQPVRWRRGIWNAATNSGKTAAFAGVLLNLVEPRAIMLVDSVDLLKQHVSFYSSVFGKENVGYVSNGKYIVGKIITIAMVKTLYNMLKKDVRVAKHALNYYNVKCYDESHEAGAAIPAYVLSRIDAGLTLFMSGTPLLSDDLGTKMKIIGLSGPELYKVSKKYLMDTGFSMRPVIKIYNASQIVRALTYENEKRTGILESKVRAELIADLIAERPDRKILITFNEYWHGHLMFQIFLAKYPEYMLEADWVQGKDEHRGKKLKAYIEGKTRILFSSTILQQGINIKDIETIIYATGQKSPISLSQFMGRGERLDGINQEFEWIDFFDPSGKHLPKHSRKRIKFYKGEELEVTFMYPARKDGTPKTN